MKKLIIATLILVAGFCHAGTLTNTTAEVQEAVRLSLTPAHLAAQLSESVSPIETPYTVADATNNLVGVSNLTIMVARDFTFDVAATNFYFSRAGATNVSFNLTASISFSQAASGSDAQITLRAMKNGAPIDGVFIKRTQRTSSTIGVAIMSGHFLLAENDVIEISVESNKTGSFWAQSFATSIIEEYQ